MTRLERARAALAAAKQHETDLSTKGADASTRADELQAQRADAANRGDAEALARITAERAELVAQLDAWGGALTRQHATVEAADREIKRVEALIQTNLAVREQNRATLEYQRERLEEAESIASRLRPSVAAAEERDRELTDDLAELGHLEDKT